jgi:hypothetical protein
MTARMEDCHKRSCWKNSIGMSVPVPYRSDVYVCSKSCWPCLTVVYWLLECNKVPSWIEPPSTLQYFSRYNSCSVYSLFASNHFSFNNCRRRSVSIVSGYGLSDLVIEVRSPAGKKGFFPLASVSRHSVAHTASCTRGTGVLSSRVKRNRGVTLTTHLHLVPRSRMSRSCTSLPQAPSWSVVGHLLASFFTWIRNWSSWTILNEFHRNF